MALDTKQPQTVPFEAQIQQSKLPAGLLHASKHTLLQRAPRWTASDRGAITQICFLVRWADSTNGAL